MSTLVFMKGDGMKKALVGGICGAVLTAAVILICGWQEQNKEEARQKFLQDYKALREKVDDLDQRVSDLEEAVLLAMEEEEDNKAPADK